MAVAAILGLGRVGARVASLLRDRGFEVRGSRRSPGPGEVPVDLARPETIGPLVHGASILVYAAAPPPYELVYGTGLRAALEAARSVERIVVLGSTSVYGEDSGALVDEDTPPAP